METNEEKEHEKEDDRISVKEEGNIPHIRDITVCIICEVLEEQKYIPTKRRRYKPIDRGSFINFS